MEKKYVIPTVSIGKRQEFSDRPKIEKKHSLACPSCREHLQISELHCPLCKVSVRGAFSQNPFLSLGPEDQEFLLEFLLVGGSLKELSLKVGKSYPTIRKRLDSLISSLRETSQPVRERGDKRKRVVELFQKGEVTAQAAEEILNKLL